MTRKKSNVKALALAVTCAILTGGGIGLEPVYAADVTLNLNNGAITAGSVIGTINGTVGGTAIADGTITDGSLTNGKFSGTVTLTGDDIKTAIEGVDISKAKVGSDATSDTIESLVKNVGDNSNAIQDVNGQVTNLDSKVEAYNTNLNTKITEQVSTLDDKINTKVNASDFSAYQVKNDKAVDTLKYNTQKIEFKKDNKVTSDYATYIEGITHAGGVRLADGAVRAKSIVLEEEFANGTSAQATLTREAIVNLNGMTDGKTKIKVADGSEVGGVTFDQGKVTNVVSINDNLKFESDGIYLNKGDQTKQIKIDNDGKIIIGTSSSAYDTDGFYAGGDDYGAAKAGIKSDGSLKATGFAVDGATGDTTVGGTLTVAGEATFAKETTFGNGIKTDKISENTPNAGVTVDGNLHANKNAFVNGMLTVNGDIEGKAALNGQTLGIGGTDNDQFTVDVNGAVKAAGGKVEIDKTGKATFGDDANNTTTIAGKVATFGESGSITDHTTINGGNLDTYNLTVRNDMNVNNFKAKNITSENRITVGDTANGVYLDANGTLSLGVDANQELGKTQLANINDTIKSGKVIEANSATIGGVEIKGGNVTTATGTIQGNTISDGAGATLTGGKITANEGKIGNVGISAAGDVTGVKSIKASTFKVDEENYLNGNGITAKGGKIGGAVINETTLSVGDTKLDSAEGITTNKLKIAGMTLTGTSLDTGTADFQVNGVTFNQGKVTAKASEGFAAGISSFKEGSLIVDANNKLEATNGLTTEKATVKGNLDVTGQATFGTVDNQTTINGKTVTTDTLKANRLILGTSGDATVEVDKDGSLIAAKGKFKVDKDGKTTFTKDADNLSSINGGNILAKATDIADNTSSELTHDYKGLHIKGNKSGQKSAFDFDTSTGIGTFTGQDRTTTTINGSAITSTKADGNTGVLDGSNLTLTNGANKTVMTAGGVTFTGKQGASTKKYNTTTIDGGIITTDTLKVQRIQLGEKIVDERTGQEIGSGVTLAADGGFTAAGGNFKVVGGATGSRGSITNVVGDDNSGKTVFETNQQGANMSFKKGDVKSEVAVADGKAEMAVGANAAVTTTDGKVEIKGGTQTVTTTDAGTVFDNGSSAVRPGGVTTTTINGNEITTGKITTDQLVITGQGNAHGNGSIAFGGNGTIKSDINDGNYGDDGKPNGKNTSFETTLEGVNTKVTDGKITTENNVSAAGNSNTVTKDGKHKSEFNQGLTSIGGVVTNGEIKVAQKLDGETGLLTNEVTDANGSSKLEQSGTGLTYTDSANAGNATRIDSSDVSIGSKENEKDRINLSDLGQIDELDKELTGHDKYKDNPTAVGGINAEAAIRREEVARLDGRINDVNDRVNKVGAMAAAIASLKSIGYDPQAPSEFSIGLGQYKGETGVAMGFFHYPNKNFMINVSLSTAGGETMGGIGATWRFGHKSPQKLLEEQREEQAKKELAAAEKYQAAAKLAKEAQERAEYAAKLARQAQVSADNAKAAADATQAKHFG